MFADSLQHILAEIERIDLLIEAQVAMARQRHVTDEHFQGLYIPEEELDRLLAQPLGAPRWAVPEDNERRQLLEQKLERLKSQIGERASQSLLHGVQLRLSHLAQAFHLDGFDVDCLLICLAPELDLRYERIIGYLHDDVTKKRPTVELVLNLLAPSLEAKLVRRERFSSDAPLFRNHLLEIFEEPAQCRSPLPGRFLKLEDRVSSYLLGSDSLDERLRDYTEKLIPDVHAGRSHSDLEVQRRLRALVKSGGTAEQPVVYLQGPYGSGKQGVAESLSEDLNLVLLIVDVERLPPAADLLDNALALLHRESVLQPGTLFFKGFDALLNEDKRPLLEVFMRSLPRQREVMFLEGEAAWEPAKLARRGAFIRVEAPTPQFGQRAGIWSAALNGDQRAENPLNVQDLATKFRFTDGQIRDAVATARSLARWRDCDEGAITMPDLYEACRLHSNQRLTSLARKINPVHRWSDIVLPADRLEQLREICNHVKYRDRVYGEWGFDGKLPLGRSLTVLFAGPSGTGKTMAAGILAAELGLDLYKIDLSTVVSKYIGETEKNLSRIFGEAETSNAILFFDEADALFGKRSEVKDAHDRYANIETGYLLQRMEEYTGVAILATNFRKNMDDAFVRRLQFTVEFPVPNHADRLRIWDTAWPESTPRAADLDFEFMARRFELSGGNIQNIVLAAAFLAADNGGQVRMSHLMRATRREYQKMGKIISDGEFAAQGFQSELES